MPAGARSLFCAAVTLALGCNINNPGDEPPRGLLYFPNALVLSKHAADEPPRYLFVANSDFDLRYNAGNVQAYSLERLEPKVRACASKPDCEIEPADVFEDEVLVGAFSTALALSPDGAHLFVSTRTEGALDYIDVDASQDKDAVLRCGTGQRCGQHSAPPGTDLLKDNHESVTWPADPQGILSGPLADWVPEDASISGDYVLVTHFDGHISSFVFDPGRKPPLQLTSVLGGRPGPLTRLAYDPTTRLVHVASASSGAGGLLDRVGIGVPRDEAGSYHPELASVYEAGVLALSGTPPTSSTFDLAFISAISGAGVALSENRALIVSQSPSALLIADVDETRNPPNLARVERSAVVGSGASRLAVGLFPDHPLAVVGSFNARELTFIDLATMQNRALIPNLSGPYAMAIDEARKFLYVADFRSSVLRVVDLTPLLEPVGDPEPRVVATVGHPHVLQELR